MAATVDSLNAAKYDDADGPEQTTSGTAAAQPQPWPQCLAAASLGELLAVLPPERRIIAVNVTPTDYHYTTNKQCLEGGCNIWSEKPLAVRVYVFPCLRVYACTCLRVHTAARIVCTPLHGSCRMRLPSTYTN